MDYETEYNNRMRVPNHGAVMEAWARNSEAARTALAARAELNVAYDTASERTKVDLFWPDNADPDTPIAIFIHGGYWRALDRTSFSFAAMGATANGVALAVPSYDLCPNVPLSTIVDQMRALCLWLYRRHARRFAVSGHSAGGHLTAGMMATDWQALDPGAPSDLVRHGVSISGLFDLEPLIGTTINEPLNLDAAEARRLSPIYEKPAAGSHLDLIVGGDESGSFIRQSRDMAKDWETKGATTTFSAPEGEDHFTVINSLADPKSDLTQALVTAARAARDL